MTKLLIVDDERNIRQGLQVMIEREFPNHYECIHARNGQEALEKVEQRAIDIVITDIRMPIMDGVQFLEKMRSFDRSTLPIQPYVIVLSGYDDFEYAKAAIRYQVREYLLKPIRREDLFEALQRLEEELQQRDLVSLSLAEVEQYRLQKDQERLQRLLYASESELALLSEQVDTLVVPEQYLLCVFQYKNKEGVSIYGQELNVLVSRLCSSQPVHYVAQLYDREDRLVWIVPATELHALEQLAEIAAQREVEGLLIGISEQGSQLQHIPQYYNEACQALHYGFLHPGIFLIRYQIIQQTFSTWSIPEEEIRLLGNTLGSDRDPEIEQRLYQIFRIHELIYLPIAYIEQVAQWINEQVLDEIFRHYGEASVEVLRLYRRVGNLNHYRYFQDYFHDLENVLICLDDYIRQLRLIHTQPQHLKEAVQFIHAHYDRPLNMAIVSNHVSLNYSYFSEAFKAYTGESFVVYLKKVRIAKAKILLIESSCRLTEISQQVGFESSRHFSKVFRELEGITPQEYRSKMNLRSLI